MSLFSNTTELKKIAAILQKFVRLPFYSPDSIPGSVMMAIVAEVRGAKTLASYDFVDVVKTKSGVGWQVKSTKAGTPVTWKRAKIPNKTALIAASHKSAAGRQALGDALIAFCNAHAKESLARFGLSEIGYSRLVVHGSGSATYFERLLCTKTSPEVFNASDFRWDWTTAKKSQVKEQLPSLHGTHVPSGAKWWAWHGLGENQLHFSGESAWWPDSASPHAITFPLYGETKMSMEEFISLLD